MNVIKKTLASLIVLDQNVGEVEEGGAKVRGRMTEELLRLRAGNRLIQELATVMETLEPMMEPRDQEESPDSLESSDSDEEEEDGDDIDERNTASQLLFKFMFDVLEKQNSTLVISNSKYRRFKTKIAMENIDRMCKPMPIHLLVNRFDRIELLFKKMSSHNSTIQRELKAMHRHDTTLFFPENMAQFSKFTYPRIVKSAKILPLPEWTNQSQCICCSSPANVSIQRTCTWCQGHHCECRQYILCEECSIRWYWDKSEGFSKSYSTCPHCRAEYCLEDIVIHRFQDPAEDLSSQIEFVKRKLADLESELEASQGQASKRVKFESVELFDEQPE